MADFLSNFLRWLARTKQYYSVIIDNAILKVEFPFLVQICFIT